jgi:hypothetical protein
MARLARQAVSRHLDHGHAVPPLGRRDRMSALSMLLAALFFFALGVVMLLLDGPVFVVVLAGAMGVVGLLAAPIAHGQSRGDPRAGRSDRGYGALSSARGGYLVVAIIAMSLFVFMGLGMLVLGQPFDGDRPYSRYVPRSPVMARIIGAFIVALASPGLVMGIRRLRATRRG